VTIHPFFYLQLIALAQEHGARITHILQTHGHIDHVAGLAETKHAALPKALVYLHPDDRPIYDAAEAMVCVNMCVQMHWVTTKNTKSPFSKRI
jgi:glyoxylase-like metal-dependent hydrolase (beta-lactamase superfamily II)